MTELEKMKRAKMYIDKLANGFDPITDTELPNDTTLNNIRLMRCFFYVSDILRQVIENDGKIENKKTKKQKNKSEKPFRITKEDILLIPISERPLSISRFCEAINDVIVHDDMKNLSWKPIMKWLVEREFIAEVNIDGANRKRAGKNASQIGIFEERRFGDRGEYLAILYSSDAQRFILGNLISILENN